MSSNEKKLIVFEGIPGGGKTSIFMEIQKLMPHLFTFIPEIVEPYDPITEQSIAAVLTNDHSKYALAKQSLLPVVMDRSYVSSINWDSVLQKQGKSNRLNEKLDKFTQMNDRNEIYPADYYFFFEVSPSTSLRRKQLPVGENLAWSTEESLAIALNHYYEYFQNQEKHSKLIVIDAEEAFNVVISTVFNYLKLILEGKL